LPYFINIAHTPSFISLFVLQKDHYQNPFKVHIDNSETWKEGEGSLTLTTVPSAKNAYKRRACCSIKPLRYAKHANYNLWQQRIPISSIRSG